MDAGYQRLRDFLAARRAEIYPEPEGLHAAEITRVMAERLLTLPQARPGARVLDIGCGKGMALELFTAAGLTATGITLGPDAQVCRDKGLDVIEMDFSFLDLPEASYDVVWCRHALEHSLFPLFTLAEIRRVLKPGGLLYLEVPAPDTACRHETNPNHYSVFGKSAWVALFAKAGFSLQQDIDMSYTVPAGPDVCWGFFLIA